MEAARGLLARQGTQLLVDDVRDELVLLGHVHHHVDFLGLLLADPLLADVDEVGGDLLLQLVHLLLAVVNAVQQVEILAEEGIENLLDHGSHHLAHAQDLHLGQVQGQGRRGQDAAVQVPSLIFRLGPLGPVGQQAREGAGEEAGEGQEDQGQAKVEDGFIFQVNVDHCFVVHIYCTPVFFQKQFEKVFKSTAF